MYLRYAVFYTPPPGLLADFGAGWLGWDMRNGKRVAHPALPDVDIAALTAPARKYGFHATIKPPFSLAEGKTADALSDAFAALCANLRPASLAGLQISHLGRFLALTVVGDQAQISDIAAQVVRDLDDFRVPPSAEELLQRNNERLNPVQRENLNRWGYPHVMAAFRFHITLTGKADKTTLARTAHVLGLMISPLLPRPFVIDSLTLVGQRQDGMFEEITRVPLARANSVAVNNAPPP